MKQTPLQNEIHFAVIVGVENANPNGDPQNDNRPRTTQDDKGVISYVSTKRKMRDRLQELGERLLIQCKGKKTDEFPSIRKRAEAAFGTAKTEEEMIKVASKTWIDFRAFGQLFAFSKQTKSKGKKAEKVESDENDEEIEEDAVSIGITGPVTIRNGFSVEPVHITEIQITKNENGEGEGKKRKSDTMGMQYTVDQGTYVIFGSINPRIAKGTGLSEEDVQKIKEILPRLYENDASAARPAGSMVVHKVIWWEIKPGEKSASAWKIQKSLKVNNDGTYVIEPIEGLVPEEIDGF